MPDSFNFNFVVMFLFGYFQVEVETEVSGFGGERSVVTAVLGLQKVLNREVHRAFPWRPGAISGRMPPWWVTSPVLLSI